MKYKEVIRGHNEAYRFIDRVCTELGMHFEKLQTIEIKPYQRPRSLPQNAKTNIMIRELAKHLGYGFDELKFWLKLEYGPAKEVVFGGKVKSIPVSTTEYSREQTSELIAQIERIAAEEGFRFSDATHETG